MLEFRSNKESEFKYKFVQSCNKYNHELKTTNGKLDFTPAMLENLKELRCVTDDTKAITKHINKKLKKKFETVTIWYQLKKFEEFRIWYSIRRRKHFNWLARER